jgi:nitrite reductase/ring-hydroxylating ferredoxin subunit
MQDTAHTKTDIYLVAIGKVLLMKNRKHYWKIHINKEQFCICNLVNTFICELCLDICKEAHMIPNQWYAVLDSKQVKKNKLIGVTRFSEKLVFWRDESGEVYCIYDKCCHRGASLCAGKLVENHVECPFHGFQYDGSGKVVRIPANGKAAKVAENYRVHAYPAKDAYGLIWVWYGDFDADLPDIPFLKS